MILWIIMTVMLSLAVVGLTIPLVRRHDLKRARDSNVTVLKAQLADIDAQEAVGNVRANEADGLRIEIKRRILAEGRVAEPPARPLAMLQLGWVALGLAAVVALSATGLYAMLGNPGIPASSAPESKPSEESAQAPQHPIGNVATMVGQLEAKLTQSPNDPEGWRMLGWSYLQTGRAADAANAYAHAASLDPRNASYFSAEGDALTQAADGTVTLKALKAFRSALSLEPADPRARYFIGVAKDQSGDHRGAMDDWIALIKSAPPDAPWLAEVRDFVERTAREHKIDISSRLPKASSQSAPSPTADQVAAAGTMSDADRDAMIHGMVDKLAAQLKANPKNRDGWIRLMRARMVLGDTAAAKKAYDAAQRAFAGASAQQASLRDAARSFGIPGA